MKISLHWRRPDYYMLFGASFLVILSLVILYSLTLSTFPLYLLFIFLGFFGYFIFLQIDFDILTVFSKHLYTASILLLILPLIIGQVTRGAIRWIPLGPLTIQPSEIVRPFLLIFFADYLGRGEFGVRRALTFVIFAAIPLLLILIQPSLGVAAITFIGILGVLSASSIKKKYFIGGFLLVVLLLPFLWSVLAPYQKQRVTTFIDPYGDPQGTGYNSIQSMISVGSGRLFGRGLGEGVQTQLAFLPEKHTDFIFAAAAEELGFVGAIFLLLGLFIIIWRLINIVEHPKNPTARAYVAGLFFALFSETVIHVGMNMGLLPITGVPLPLVSAGGSAFLGTMLGLAIAVNAKKEIST